MSKRKDLLDGLFTTPAPKTESELSPTLSREGQPVSKGRPRTALSKRG